MDNQSNIKQLKRYSEVIIVNLYLIRKLKFNDLRVGCLWANSKLIRHQFIILYDINPPLTFLKFLSK